MTEDTPTPDPERKPFDQLISERRARRGVRIPEPPRRLTGADIAKAKEHD